MTHQGAAVSDITPNIGSSRERKEGASHCGQVTSGAGRSSSTKLLQNAGHSDPRCADFRERFSME